MWITDFFCQKLGCKSCHVEHADGFTLPTVTHTKYECTGQSLVWLAIGAVIQQPFSGAVSGVSVSGAFSH